MRDFLEATVVRSRVRSRHAGDVMLSLQHRVPGSAPGYLMVDFARLSK